ncbi:hypothetical protein M8818_005280 [Zalaria obscura]|uniref:Uncharacterized protein n=1 Tax=Zalaria obscura TaxID=2024903 RepID=A0ACC3S9W9_9PEZI
MGTNAIVCPRAIRWYRYVRDASRPPPGFGPWIMGFLRCDDVGGQCSRDETQIVTTQTSDPCSTSLFAPSRYVLTIFITGKSPSSQDAFIRCESTTASESSDEVKYFQPVFQVR